ncbi:uncharacterized protein LOC62_04G006602 [Vanrija pseudolonga]|uniref:Uncharacterized protein n=1 Tax=Vanrija pseudolonga TaxID=143232 RepID=A0AAF0YE17_9TREE|nr:hypothetical protein LOC62_04G006602 [Vanrija pseudolonga]
MPVTINGRIFDDDYAVPPSNAVILQSGAASPGRELHFYFSFHLLQVVSPVCRDMGDLPLPTASQKEIQTIPILEATPKALRLALRLIRNAAEHLIYIANLLSISVIPEQLLSRTNEPALLENTTVTVLFERLVLAVDTGSKRVKEVAAATVYRHFESLDDVTKAWVSEYQEALDEANAAQAFFQARMNSFRKDLVYDLIHKAEFYFTESEREEAVEDIVYFMTRWPVCHHERPLGEDNVVKLLDRCFENREVAFELITGHIKDFQDLLARPNFPVH